MKTQEVLSVTPQNVLSYLIQASKKHTQDQVAEENRYREIGFEDTKTQLGWMIPPAWRDVERRVMEFMSLELIRDKKYFIFVGMGASINTVKALIQLLGDPHKVTLYTLDSLDPTALGDLFSSIDDPSRALIIGVSKSGLTRETQDLLKAVREIFESKKLPYHKHFLVLTDLLQGKQNMEDMAWQDLQTLPIQVNRKTDIGGRFSAPHTLIFLLPLFLLLNQDMKRLKALWDQYLNLREQWMLEVATQAHELAKEGSRYLAIVMEESLVYALETWSIQLVQESLGSKIAYFDPKTVITVTGATPAGFHEVRIGIPAPTMIVKAMLTMFLLQVFVATFAFYKNINFVTQPKVEEYKKKITGTVFHKPHPQRITITELIEKIRNSLPKSPHVKFIEVICYWYLQEESRNHLKQIFHKAFPDKAILVFEGSDWNHHSYQAAIQNGETLFILLIKRTYKQRVKGVSAKTLKKNITTLTTIAHLTLETLQRKAELFEVEDWSVR